jgi:phosphate transport system ATP-binding protein
MQHESHTHGINMSALGRDKQSLSLAKKPWPSKCRA